MVIQGMMIQLETDDTDVGRQTGTITIRTSTCQTKPLLCIIILAISALFVYDIGLRIGFQIQILVRLFRCVLASL